MKIKFLISCILITAYLSSCGHAQKADDREEFDRMKEVILDQLAVK